MRDWPVLSALKRRVVNPEGADVLRQLGFEGIRPITLCGLLRDEMGTDKRIDLVVRHVIIFGHGHGLQRAIIDESQHRAPERLIMAQH